MEQKLICVHENGAGSVRDTELEKYLNVGWRIVDISAAGRSLETVCWVLLEK